MGSWLPIAADITTILALLVGVGTYIYEIPGRNEARATSAWQILALQAGHEGNGGQKWALRVLYGYGGDLHGVHVEKADLSSSPDYPKQQFSLPKVNLAYSDLWRSNLYWANLRGAYLQGAELSCTTLSRGDFSGADFSGAKLSGANVTAANFTDAKLVETKLNEICIDRAGNPQDQPVGLGQKVSLSCPAYGQDTRDVCKDTAAPRHP